MKVLSILMFCALVSACSTPYVNSKYSIVGGYDNYTATKKLEKVVFYGNGYTEYETALEFGLRRCAEFVVENGKEHFLMYNTLTSAAKNKPSSVMTLGAVGGKPVAFAYVMLLDEEQEHSMKASSILSAYSE